MRLTPECHHDLERFFRMHTRDARLRLPDIVLVDGTLARLVTRALGVAAVTLGRVVLVERRELHRGDAGRVLAPAELIVHEAAHVLQYRAAGTLRFLVGYAGGYLRELLRGRRWHGPARYAAYRAIPAERAARAAAAAYLAWSRARTDRLG